MRKIKPELKKVLLSFLLLLSIAARAQKIDSIYVNLYTDSLKKGTYNYINVDGLLANGRYLPLDSSHIIFSSNYGKFYGNSLWIENIQYRQPVNIHVALKKNPAVCKDFVMFVKTKEDDRLKSAQELLDEMQQQPKKRRRSD